MHASGSDEEYVISAIENGFETMGFSDHCAWRFADPSFRSTMRMDEAGIGDYVDSVLSLKEKYRDRIEILLGWEVEYFPKYMSWMRETLEKYGFDYVILGHHFRGDEIDGDYNGNLRTKKQIGRYADDVCAAIESGLFSYVAHPDLFMRGYGRFDQAAEDVSRRIIETAIENRVPLEYNVLGLENNLREGYEGYPHSRFWSLAAEAGATAIIGIDAHSPEKYGRKDLISTAEQRLEALGIEVVDEIKLLR